MDLRLNEEVGTVLQKMIAARVPWPLPYFKTQAQLANNAKDGTCARRPWPPLVCTTVLTVRIILERSSAKKGMSGIVETISYKQRNRIPRTTSNLKHKRSLCHYDPIHQPPPDHAHHCCVHLRIISSFTGCICATVWLIFDVCSVASCGIP